MGISDRIAKGFTDGLKGGMVTAALAMTLIGQLDVASGTALESELSGTKEAELLRRAKLKKAHGAETVAMGETLLEFFLGKSETTTTPQPPGPGLPVTKPEDQPVRGRVLKFAS